MAEIFDFYVADNRTIKFNPIEPILQEDNGVAVWRFRIPKVLNNIDMSGFAWWFVYINAAKQKYSEPLTLTADADDPDNYCITDYTIDYGISLTPGSFTFALEAINANGSGEIIEEWHTKTYSHSVIGTLQGNQAEYSETESDIISALIVQIQQKYNALVGGATPIPVASVSAMTDTTKVYLNTTDKNWYFYNGSAWVSGGQYASGIVIDPTLTQSGQAADAKVVGDEIAGLDDALGGFYESNDQEIPDTDLTRHDGKRYGVNGNLIDNTPASGRAEAVEIPVTAGEVIKWVCYYANRNATYNIKYLSGSGIVTPDTNYTASGNEYVFTVPSDCVKVLASCWVTNSVGNHFYRRIEEYQDVKEYVDEQIQSTQDLISNDVAALETNISNTYITNVKGITPDYPTLFDKNNIISEHWYDYTDGGKVKARSGRFLYPLVPCKPNTTYTKRTCNICIFDSNKTLLSTIMWNDSNVFVTPSNAAYFGVSMTTPQLESVRLVEGERPSGAAVRQPVTAISPEQIKTFIVDKAGTGDYLSLTEAITANAGKKCRFEVRAGEYDLATEYTDLYGSDFFSSDTFSNEGLVIDNGTEVILDSAAIVLFNYTGSNARVMQYFSPFKFSGSGGVLKGGQIKCSNCRYAIHDDTYSSPHDKRLIDGVYIHYRSERNVAIGGGLGYSSDVEIKNCYVDSGDTGYGVFYHNASYADAENIVKIHDNYFTAGIYIQPYGPSTTLSRAIVSNNKARTVARITTEMTEDNFELVAWNNVTSL